MGRKGRLGCYIPKCMEEEISKTTEEVEVGIRHRRSEAMKIIVRRSQIGKDFEMVSKRMSSLPMFFQTKKKRKKGS